MRLGGDAIVTPRSPDVKPRCRLAACPTLTHFAASRTMPRPRQQAVSVDQQDVERIARQALKELGASTAAVSVTVGDAPGTYRIDLGGTKRLLVRCGPGSTAQWVRNQIFDQYLAR